MTRKAIFDAVRDAAPDGLFDDPGNIYALDNLLDAFGVPRESEATGFDRALAVVLKHEGGYVNHPRDPGGATNLGVTIKTWRDWKGGTVTIDDMRALTIEDVKPLYRERYWNAVRADDLPAGLALCCFDFGVNAGPGRAVKLLQRICGTTSDGVFGPATQMALQAALTAHGERNLIERYSEARRDYYRALGTFQTFGRGWLRRVDETETAALEVAA